jgi:hypothetical protein
MNIASKPGRIRDTNPHSAKLLFPRRKHLVWGNALSLANLIPAAELVVSTTAALGIAQLPPTGNAMLLVRVSTGKRMRGWPRRRWLMPHSSTVPLLGSRCCKAMPHLCVVLLVL